MSTPEVVRPGRGETVMVADDDRAIVFAFRKVLEKSGYRVITAEDGDGVLGRVRENRPGALFLDISMPSLDGLSVLERLRDEGLDVPVIVITGFGTMHTAIRAVQLGAFEYLTKPLDVDKVRAVAERALEVSRLRREVSDLRARLRRSAVPHELVGNNPAMQDVYKTIGAVTTTPNSTNVLILGESGTGKELVARGIHANGPHHAEPFVAINCTVLPETLLESELFGHEKGAFTGADSSKQGKFEVAGGGTVFLDEIGDMPVKLQQKLLRVVEERTFQRVGGNTSIPVRARFIAATNRDIQAEVRKGAFREDLYFRLNVISIHLPPLRERADDIPLLVDHFLARLADRGDGKLRRVDEAVLAMLARYPFPGNVRELENMIERAMVLERRDVLTPESFPPFLHEERPRGVLDVPVPSGNLAEARHAVIESFERKYVMEALKRSHGNVTAAASAAGLERQSFQRLMKKYEIHSEDFRGD
jgi:DNA-binding NtrC family response regulator